MDPKHVLTKPVGGTAIDAQGNIYVSSLDQQEILKISPNGTTSVFIHDERLLWVDAMWVDTQQKLWMPAAQLNRGIEGRAEKTPTLADLRESGGIEAAADFVLLMHRTTDQPNDLLVTIAKNRHGPQGHLTLNFRGEFSRIEDLYPNHLGAAS